MPKKLVTCASVTVALLLTTITLLHAGNTMPVPTAKDKCPVCGMFVKGYPNWLAAIRLKNGSAIYFDGPKDLFNYYLNPGKYAPATKQSEFSEILVKDYYAVKPIDARQAYFVAGSDVLGPMGKELIPLAKKEDAIEFRADHKGNKVYRFQEVTPAVLKTLE
ncbi:nitrous oxide reductase accessory protein NosL [Geobacter pelophilus]|uniref:Nitrous oxide reductase accessory protein NosL n=1 Tax=Geoanaerobacter pelophilus TaxID=60036 RepID=A0AAW4L4H8_9BACT|nr:nitrous oxide reductase accessory protein NosL [Geoanaerobacter pelophilus]MBT0666109.1 nitrous oxide reductase accessory protein NosL [Geoanaerobacter pelophilus]